MKSKLTNNDAVFLHEGFKARVFVSVFSVALLGISLAWESAVTVAEICQGFFLFSAAVVGARAAQQWGYSRGGVYNGIDRAAARVDPPPGTPPEPPTQGL